MNPFIKQDVTFDEVMEAQEKLNRLRYEYWREEIVFSWQGLTILFVLILAVGLFIKLVDRSRLPTILLFGSVTAFIALELDMLGTDLTLWDYPRMILPWGARLFCVDLVLAIIFSLIYQKCRAWKAYWLAQTMVALVFSFLLEPLTIKMGIYKPHLWEHYYSLPIYVLIGVFCKWLIERIHWIQRKGSTEGT